MRSLASAVHAHTCAMCVDDHHDHMHACMQWVSAGLYAGFGVFQSLVGPCLVLSPAPDAGLDCEGGGTPAPSIAIAEDEGLDPQSV